MQRERPRVGVALFLMRGDEALFILRRGPHRKGCWGLVGGHLEHGESPQDAAARECLEEVGVDLHPELIVPRAALPVVNFLRQPVRPPFNRASPPHGIRR